MNEIAHWILRNGKDEIIAEFESNITIELFREYLHCNFNRFDKKKFFKYIESIKIVKNKFIVL